MRHSERHLIIIIIASLAAAALTHCGPQKTTALGRAAGGAGSSADCEGAKDATPDPLGFTGQLNLNIPDDVDPCSVSGYIVGHKDDLKIELTSSGEFFINNVPPGDNDVLIVAGTLNIPGALIDSATPDRGIRINDVRVSSGLRNNLGEVNLPKLGAISGVATLASGAVTDHAGILVYIPGTSFAAYTNTDGAYSMTGVPAGQHSLYFEKDGFARGRIEGFMVDSEVTSVAPDVKLYLDTGITGNFSLVNSFTVGGYPIVPGSTAQLLMAPSADAVLMLVGDGGLSPSAWKPVTTNSSFTFDSAKVLNWVSQTQGATTTFTSPIKLKLTARFANQNGLESDSIVKEPYIDFFGSGSSLFTPQFNAAFTESPLQISVTGLTTPPGAEQVSIEDARDKSPVTSTFVSLTSSKTFPIKRKLDDCGDHRIQVQFKGYGGRVVSSKIAFQSETQSNPFGTATGTVVNVPCHDEVPANSAILQPTVANPASNQPGAPTRYYHAVWTGPQDALKGPSATDDGSRIAVFGWNDADVFTGAFYDPKSGVWTKSMASADAPTARTSAYIYVLGSKILVVGGKSTTSGYNLGSVGVYDIASDDDPSDQIQGKWIGSGTNAPSMSPDLTFRGHSGIVKNGKIHFLYQKINAIGSSNFYLTYNSDHTWSNEVDLSDSNGTSYVGKQPFLLDYDASRLLVLEPAKSGSMKLLDISGTVSSSSLQIINSPMPGMATSPLPDQLPVNANRTPITGKSGSVFWFIKTGYGDTTSTKPSQLLEFDGSSWGVRDLAPINPAQEVSLDPNTSVLTRDDDGNIVVYYLLSSNALPLMCIYKPSSSYIPPASPTTPGTTHCQFFNRREAGGIDMFKEHARAAAVIPGYGFFSWGGEKSLIDWSNNATTSLQTGGHLIRVNYPDEFN